MDRPISESTPIACTLDARRFEERLAWIADLNRRALIDARRDDLRLELIYRSHAVEDVRELVHCEQHCCAFLRFDLSVDTAAVRLVVTAPEDARQAAELVFEPFQSKSAIASNASCGCNTGWAQ